MSAVTETDFRYDSVLTTTPSKLNASKVNEELSLLKTEDPTTLLATGERKSIFDFYSAPNELKFVTEQLHKIPQEQVAFYLRENITKFLGEFAGKIPYTYVTYTIDGDRIKYAGMDLLEMLERTNEKAGYGSREWYENAGLIRAYNAHLGNLEGIPKPGAHFTAIISPPKDWDYNFTFLNERTYDESLGQEVMRMHAVRRTEQRGTVDESKRILHRLVDNPKEEGKYSSTEAFLMNPIIDPHTIHSVDEGLRAIGLTEKEILYSRLFEQEVSMQLTELIEKYTTEMMRLAVEQTWLAPTVIEQRLKSLNQMISTAYVIAEDIRESVKKSISTPARNVDSSQTVVGQRPHFASVDEMFRYAAGREAWVVGGGSCPVAGMSPLYASSGAILSGMKNGFAPEYQLFMPPSMDITQPVYGRKLTNCPECGKKDVVLHAEDINAGRLKCDNPSCLKHHSPQIATTNEEREGILCIWHTSRDFLVLIEG